MSESINRRSFLRYVGAGAAGVVAGGDLGPLARAAAAAQATTQAATRATAGVIPATRPAADAGRAWVAADGSPAWWPVRYPVPQPGDGGDAPSDARRLATYEVRDDLTLPDGYRYDVVAGWGDVLGPSDDESKQIRFGFNCDYTGLVPVPESADEFWLVVNHEYISARPWLQGFETAHGKVPPLVRLLTADAEAYPSGRLVVGETHFDDAAVDLQGDGAKKLPADVLDQLRAIGDAGLNDLGVSVVRVRRLADGRFEPVREATDHRRIGGLSRANVPDEITFSGPAAALLPATAPGTFANCSGGTTPWGTVLTCEENFQDQVMEFVTPTGEPLPGTVKSLAAASAGEGMELPFEFEGLGQGVGGDGADLDGRMYGWVCEVDPATGRMVKHTNLGRFRHENVAIRCEAGKPLACYMGDDRRGGHVWKYVSRGVVTDPKDPANSKLLSDGTLHVARFHPDFTGEWVALENDTPLVRPEPQHTTGGFLFLPKRDPQGHDQTGGHVAVGTGKQAELSVDEWVEEVLAWPWGSNATGLEFGQLRLENLTMSKRAGAGDRDRQGVILTDAYAMANCVGGTPTARPEDVEVHPQDGSVYIAFTDTTGSGDGSPDARIFPDSAGDTSRQYGAIYRVAEDGDDPAAKSFAWGKFVSSGEAADGGGGFACADNLAFDPDGNLWMVCDISTTVHNFPVSRERKQDAPGGKAFAGVFGNNAMFMIPTTGERAGVPHCFAIGPVECEITGPTFTKNPDGGWSLLVSIQHPGELHGTRRDGAAEVRTMKVAARDGTVFEQKRVVPLGSNFPSGEDGRPPRPCVVCVTRTA